MKNLNKESSKKENLFKKYFLHLLNIFSLLFIIFPFFVLTKYSSYNIFIISFILEILSVLFTLFEIVYFIIKAVRLKNLKNKIVKIFFIFLFSWIYIPFFYTKYIYTGTKSKKSMVTYIVLSSLLLLFVICYISYSVTTLRANIASYSLPTETNTYFDNNNFIKISIPNNYIKEENGPYDLSFHNENSMIGLFLFENTWYTADNVLKLQVHDLLSKRENSVLIDSFKTSKDGKRIISQIYKYENNGTSFVANFSTITFDKKGNFVIYILQNCPELLYEKTYKNSFENILESIKLINKN